jgi:hypothetical protein
VDVLEAEKGEMTKNKNDWLPTIVDVSSVSTMKGAKDWNPTVINGAGANHWDWLRLMCGPPSFVPSPPRVPKSFRWTCLKLKPAVQIEEMNLHYEALF